MTAGDRPPLVALVYRLHKGCGQYPFGSADELQAWAARLPYRNETVIVHAVNAEGKFAAPKTMPALAAADYVRKATAEVRS